MIKIEIDKYGQITSQIDQVRQGDKGVVVQATFEDKDNINYVAKINLTRNDGEMASGLIMQPDAEHSDTFVRTLESEWYFCKKGQTSLTVYLYKGGVVDAQGQVNFNVEETDYDGEPTITPDQYDELIELIATKLGIKDSIVVADTIRALDDLHNYNVGQVFYIRNDGKIYQLDSSYNPDTVIDLYLVDFTILDEVEVSETKTTNKITKSIALKNTHGQTFYDFDIEFNVATTSDAGLMSASDKTKLSALPTGEQIAQQHTILHNEVVAEKNRAQVVEAQKEDKANKKNVISGDSTTNYPSVKAVKDFVNDAINNVSAYYITKNATGDAFESVAQLTSATTFYSGGQVRTPTRNDYCIVRTDENHDNATTRYIYQGSQWEFQYIVNEEPLTDAQLQAINSGITEAKVNAYDTHIADTNKHIQSGEREKWNEVVNKQIKNKTFDHIPQANELEEGQVGIVQSIEEEEMPEVIIGDGLEVITDIQGNKTLKTDLGAVAYSNDYEDLDNKPFASIGDGLEVSSTGRLQSSKHLYKYNLEVYLKTSDGEERVTAIAVGTDINTTYFNEFSLMSDLQSGLLFNFAILAGSSFAPAKFGLYGGKVYLSYIKENVTANVYSHVLDTRQITRLGTIIKSEIF